MQVAQAPTGFNFNHFRVRAALDVCLEGRAEMITSARHLRTAQVEVAELLHIMLEYDKCRLPLPADVEQQVQNVARSSWRAEKRFQSLAEAYLMAAKTLDELVCRKHLRRDPRPELADALKQAQAALTSNVAAVVAGGKLSADEKVAVRRRVASGQFLRSLDALLATADKDLLNPAYLATVDDDETANPKAIDELASEFVQVYRVADELLMTQRC